MQSDGLPLLSKSRLSLYSPASESDGVSVIQPRGTGGLKKSGPRNNGAAPIPPGARKGSSGVVTGREMGGASTGGVGSGGASGVGRAGGGTGAGGGRAGWGGGWSWGCWARTGAATASSHRPDAATATQGEPGMVLTLTTPPQRKRRL